MVFSSVPVSATLDATGSYGVVFTAFFVCNVSAVVALGAVRARR